MRHRVIRVALFIVVPVAFVMLTAGCGVRGGSLPDSVTIELPDGSTTSATLGSGVARLADTTWEFFVTAGPEQAAPFVKITFGPLGNLETFDDNTIAADIFGSQLIFDGQRHSTTVSGITYTAGTYGAETSDANGFAFEGRLNAFAAGFLVARGNASASGNFDPDNPDLMTGTFSFEFEVTVSVPGVPETSGNETFGFIAHRVVDQE
jgi:hypothetical protein